MSGKVRAKFRVTRYETALDNGNNGRELRTIHLSPVYSQDKESENGKFWAYTPSGSIQLGTVNPDAWQHFELGKEYFVDFTLAESE